MEYSLKFDLQNDSDIKIRKFYDPEDLVNIYSPTTEEILGLVGLDSPKVSHTALKNPKLFK